MTITRSIAPPGTGSGTVTAMPTFSAARRIDEPLRARRDRQVERLDGSAGRRSCRAAATPTVSSGGQRCRSRAGPGRPERRSPRTVRQSAGDDRRRCRRAASRGTAARYAPGERIVRRAIGQVRRPGRVDDPGGAVGFHGAHQRRQASGFGRPPPAQIVRQYVSAAARSRCVRPSSSRSRWASSG